MPKSKRSKVVSLTQVRKKGKEHKEAQIEQIKKLLEEYKYLFVLTFKNMTTNPFKKIKQDFEDSKFLLGKNKLAQYALGTSQDNETAENVHIISEMINGKCCLLFTNQKASKITKYFEEYSTPEFAQAGAIAPKNVTLEKEGTDLAGLSYSIEPYLRELGLPTKLHQQKITLN